VISSVIYLALNQQKGSNWLILKIPMKRAGKKKNNTKTTQKTLGNNAS